MNPALVMLNQVIDQGHITVFPSPDDCREALRTIELFPLAAGALKTLLEFPDNKEGIAHAKRCLEHLAESERRELARKAERAGMHSKAPYPSTPPTPIQIRDEADVADLA